MRAGVVCRCARCEGLGPDDEPRVSPLDIAEIERFLVTERRRCGYCLADKTANHACVGVRLVEHEGLVDEEADPEGRAEQIREARRLASGIACGDDPHAFASYLDHEDERIAATVRTAIAEWDAAMKEDN